MPRLTAGSVGAMASAGPLAGIEDQSYQPRAAFIPGIVYLADAVGTQTETLAIRGLSLGVGIGRIARREARSPDCSSAAFSRPRCCPSSASCGTILHGVDVDTQIEAAVGGEGRARDGPAVPDPIGQPEECRAAFKRWGADRTQLVDGL